MTKRTVLLKAENMFILGPLKGSTHKIDDL